MFRLFFFLFRNIILCIQYIYLLSVLSLFALGHYAYAKRNIQQTSSARANRQHLRTKIENFIMFFFFFFALSSCVVWCDVYIFCFICKKVTWHTKKGTRIHHGILQLTTAMRLSHQLMPFFPSFGWPFSRSATIPPIDLISRHWARQERKMRETCIFHK